MLFTHSPPFCQLIRPTETWKRFCFFLIIFLKVRDGKSSNFACILILINCNFAIRNKGYSSVL